jgi:hypothetical protein
MRLLLVGLICCSFSASAQENARVDSLTYYQREMGRMRRAALDSLHKKDSFQTLRTNIERLRSQSENYQSFAVFTEYFSGDHTRFNQSIATSGFAPLDPGFLRIGFGFSFKQNRLMTSIYYGIFGLGNKVKKGDQKIRANATNILQAEFGYNLIQSKKFNLYPYAGGSIRLSEINYTASQYADTGFTNITNLLQANRNVALRSTKLNYVAGLGMELVVEENKELNSGLIIFVKAGTSGILGRNRYQYAGIKYDPGIRQGDWLITFGVKFFGRG